MGVACTADPSGPIPSIGARTDSGGPPYCFARGGWRASLLQLRIRQAALSALLIASAAGCMRVLTPAPAASSGPGAQLITLGDFDDALLGNAIFAETIRVRAANGLRPLAHHPALDEAAAEQASYMALMFRADHSNPTAGEHNSAERVRHAGVDGLRVGENLIMMPARRPAGSEPMDYTYGELAALIVDSWMNSPEHRSNLLDPRFTALGCAARVAHGVEQGDERVFAAQVFLMPFPTDQRMMPPAKRGL